MIDCDWLTV